MKEVLEFASSVQRAVKTYRLYNSEHPRVKEVTAELTGKAASMMRHERVQLVTSRGRLFFQGEPLSEESTSLDWLVEQLTQRKVNGFVFSDGITERELQEFVQIFVLKPQQLDELGGPARLLSDIDSAHIRVSNTRFEELRDGEVVIPASERGVGGGGFDPTGALQKLSDGELDDQSVGQLAGFVASWLSQAKGEASADSEGDDGDAASGSGAPGTGTALEDLSAQMSEFLRQESSGMSLLQKRLTDLGISRGELDEILEAVAWENLGIDDRLNKSLDGSVIFELPIEKVLSFVLELVQLKRNDDALKLVNKLGEGLLSESTEVRRQTTDGFQRICGWMIDPGLTPEIEALTEKLLLTHFVREDEPQIQRRSQVAFMRLYDSWIERNQIEKALQTIRKVQTVMSAASNASPWKNDVYGELIDRLTSEERTAALLERMFKTDLETTSRLYHPLLAFFGGAAAPRLLDALEAEEDRGRRGRLVKAIKALGKPALHHLESALKSSTWYLVRNALNVLGDLTAIDLLEPMAETLSHEDERVRRAAARALSKLGGRRVERHLADALPKNSGETQIEILLALGSLKAESVIDDIAELTRAKRLTRSDDPARIKAIETLGIIGSPKAVPTLAEPLKKKGLLGGQEPAEVRRTAAVALVAIGSSDALNVALAAAAAETDPAVKAEISKAIQAAKE